MAIWSAEDIEVEIQGMANRLGKSTGEIALAVRLEIESMLRMEPETDYVGEAFSRVGNRLSAKHALALLARKAGP